MTMPARYVVVGAGHAGVAAAEALAQAARSGEAACRVLLVDADPALPYERPSLSKEMLTAERFPAPARHDWAARGIAFRGGARVVAIDAAARELSLSDGSRIAYDRLLLAPGGSPRALPVPGGDLALGLRSRADAERLHAALRAARHLVVVGAGVIGLEVAASARALGLAVTVVETAPRPMMRSLPAEDGDFLTGLHRAKGVDFAYGATLHEIARQGDGRLELRLDGATLTADLVVAGVGFVPEIALARQAGLRTDRGILVDADARTSDPAIWAAGDATVFPDATGAACHWQTWQHARRHGAHAARRMAGLASAYAPVPWFWTDQHGCNIQILGNPLAGDAAVLRGDVTARAFTRIHLAGRKVAGAVMVNRGADNRPLQALIESGQDVDRQLLEDISVPLRAPGARKAAGA